MTQNVGLAEISGFNHYEITGTDAMDWLDSLTCSRLSKIR
jgi:dimethylglycine dehydrogenase